MKREIIKTPTGVENPHKTKLVKEILKLTKEYSPLEIKTALNQVESYIDYNIIITREK